MIRDALTVFSDAQETTVSAASTDIVNTLAAGDSYEGAWFVSRIDTAVTSGGTPTVTFQLQTAETEDFSGATAATLLQSAAYLKGALIAGKFFAARVPPGAKQYLRGYVSIASADLTAGKFDMEIVKDISLDITTKERYLLGQ